MKKDKFNIYRNTILDKYPDATNIREPKVCGAQHSVLFADTKQHGGLVFKFSDKNLVYKNARASYVYNVRKIPVPLITPHAMNGLYFEEYPLISGTTLYEAIQQGIDMDQVKQIYKDVLVEFYKMSRVYPENLGTDTTNNITEVARLNTLCTNGAVAANVISLLAAFANFGCRSDAGVYHANITPKNIIVSDSGTFKAFVDVDSVCICDKNFAFGTMAAKYQQMGLDTNDLLEYYKKISGQELNDRRIKATAVADGLVKKILWTQSQKKHR